MKKIGDIINRIPSSSIGGAGNRKLKQEIKRMNNPIRASYGKTEKVIVPVAGNYKATLKMVEEKDLPKWGTPFKEQGEYTPEELEKKLVFAFTLNKVAGCWIRKKCAPTNHERGNLTKFLREACPDFTESMRSSVDEMWKFCLGLVGREFYLQVEPSKTPNGHTYNKLIKVSPTEIKETVPDAPPAALIKHDKPFEDMPDVTDDDSIPF